MIPSKNPNAMSDDEFAEWLADLLGSMRGQPLSQEQRERLRSIVAKERDEIEAYALKRFLG